MSVSEEHNNGEKLPKSKGLFIYGLIETTSNRSKAIEIEVKDFYV